MSSNYDYLYKFIIIGDSCVGKSCMLLRFAENRFKNDHQPTLGVEFGSKQILCEGLTIKIQIWDTAGQQSFKAITRSYYKGSIAAFLVFDVSKYESFENLNKWLYEINNHSHDKVEIVIIGNKSDLGTIRQVSQKTGKNFADMHGYAYWETSAKSGENIQNIFKSAAEKITKKIQNKQINPISQTSYGIRPGKKNRKEQNNTIQYFQSPNQESNNNGIKKNCCGR